MRKRPESPELDLLQGKDLLDFLKGLEVSSLEQILHQTIKDASEDTGSYSDGGTPANTTRAIAFLQSLIDEKTRK